MKEGVWRCMSRAQLCSAIRKDSTQKKVIFLQHEMVGTTLYCQPSVSKVLGSWYDIWGGFVGATSPLFQGACKKQNPGLHNTPIKLESVEVSLACPYLRSPKISCRYTKMKTYGCYGLNCISTKSKCWSPNPQYFRMGPYLDRVFR